MNHTETVTQVPIARRTEPGERKVIDTFTPAVRYCAGCNEIEGSSYAKHCCTPNNMIEA